MLLEQNKIDLKPTIINDWDGAYTLKIGLEAKADVQAWEVNFFLPYSIRKVFGTNLIDNGNGNYTISGKNNDANLSKGQLLSTIIIVDDNGEAAILPEFDSAVSHSLTTTEDVNTVNTIDELVSKDKNTNAQPNSNQKLINVDQDFGGDLDKAIAAADNGDVVQLGANIYPTKGITIDKDITIDGQDGSIIDGEGTSKSILSLTPGASGTTIQDVEITNGNNGILGAGASNLLLQNLDINNIGITETIRSGPNNIGIELDHADGLQLRNSTIHNIGRKAVGIVDTDGADISNLSIHDVNLEAEHAQSHDAGGIKFFNTNDVHLKDSYFTDINGNNIWNDLTNLTTIENNVVENAGEDFLAPAFNNNVYMSGISNEKSSNSVVIDNKATSVGDFLAFKATEFSVETMTFEGNDFSSYELGTTDYWVNEPVEKLIALTENPDMAGFSLFAEEYAAQANIGD